MIVERSIFNEGVLRIRDNGTLFICYHAPTRTFGYVRGTYFEAVLGGDLTVPKEIVAECLAYSMTGKLRGET